MGAKVDVIITAGTVAANAAKKATGSIPIVAMTTDDPVATRLVASLARPGGNLTGRVARVGILTAQDSDPQVEEETTGIPAPREAPSTRRVRSITSGAPETSTPKRSR